MMLHDGVLEFPVGRIRRGWCQIAEGYSKLLDGKEKIHVTIHDFMGQGGNDWHLYGGRERGACKTPTETLDVSFRTARWFVRKKAPGDSFTITDRSRIRRCSRTTSE